MTRSPKNRNRGVGIVMVIAILVILAAISVGMVSMSRTQHISSAQDMESIKAFTSAGSGNEWGLYQAIKNGSCSASSTLDMTADTGFHVTVSCTADTYNEGESAPGTPASVTIYRIDSVACNSSSCPDPSRAGDPYYIERKRQVIATN